MNKTGRFPYWDSRSWRLLSIRTKLTLGTFALLGGVAWFLLSYIPAQVSRQAILQMAQGAEAVSEITAYSLVPGVLFDDEEAIETVIEGARRDVDIRYMVVEDSLGNELGGVDVDLARRAAYRETDEQNPIASDSLLKVVESIRYEDRIVGHVYLGHSLDAVHASVAESRQQLALVIAGVFLFAFVGILSLASVLTRPLAHIMRAAEDISAGNLGRRSGIDSEDEVGRFASVFDSMVERLQATQEELRGLNRSLEDRVTTRTSELHHALSETREAEREARQSEQRFRGVFDSSAIGIALCDPGLRLIEVNTAFEAMWCGDRSRVLELTALDLLDQDSHPEVVSELDQVMTGQRDILQREFRARPFDGSDLWVNMVISAIRDANEKVVFVVAMVQDVTEQRTMADQLQQSQKLEAVGRLAGGVAHDFNNLLTVINGVSEMMLAEVGPGDQMREDLQEIKKAGDRAADLTRQLLAFSRRQPLKLRPMDVNASIWEMSALLKRLIGEHITLDLVLGPRMPLVKADPGQIGQIVMNLAVNARDAMPKGGHLMIETSVRELRPEGAARFEMAAGPAVQIALTDTGCGMDPQTLAHVFEPFFTTKAPGEGTGLGLATVYGLVKQSGGGITVESEPGRGTTFVIALPVTEELEHEDRKNPAKESAEGRETILVVEDESAVRKVTVRILESRGYRTVPCATPLEALAVFEKNPNGVHGVVSDIVMPEMSGPEMAQAMYAIRPGLPILFVSGYPRDVRESFGVDDPTVDFLQKPTSPHELATAVRSMLDRGEEFARSPEGVGSP